MLDRREGESAAEYLHRTSGDACWLDPEYARRMAGPTMAAMHSAATAEAREKAEAVRRRRDPLMVYLRRMLCSARKNAARKGYACSITDADLWAMLEAGGRRCAVTGVPFSLDRHKAGRAPRAPSMDRIDDSRGYEPGNVRLVCQLANLAMNVWDDRTLLDFIADARNRPRVLVAC